MRCFVTGGAGFIGSNFVRGLLTGAWGHDVERVTVFDSFTYAGNRTNLEDLTHDPRLTITNGDIRDRPELDKSLPGHDVIFHFAAESHVDRSIRSASVFVSTNVLGTHHLLEAALLSKIETFIHISTDEVYGSISDGSWDESQPVNPNSPYAASKASSDLLVLAYARTFGIDARITRCSNNFGFYQHPEKVIPLFITNLLDNFKVPLYGDGLNVRDWLHVDDHCSAISLVAEQGRPGEIYNIGGGSELTNLDLTKLILKACGKDQDMIQPVADRLAHDRRYSVDWNKSHSELGYVPNKRIEDEIYHWVEWYSNNEKWWRPLKQAK